MNQNSSPSEIRPGDAALQELGVKEMVPTRAEVPEAVPTRVLVPPEVVQETIDLEFPNPEVFQEAIPTRVLVPRVKAGKRWNPEVVQKIEM